MEYAPARVFAYRENRNSKLSLLRCPLRVDGLSFEGASRTGPVTPGSQKILIVGPSWVGDMVMAQSLFIKLKILNPQVHLTLLAATRSYTLARCMPQVDELIELPFQAGQFAPLARWRWGRKLRQKSFQQAIVLPNSWKSAIIPWAAGIAQRSGWLGESRYGLLNDARKLDRKKYPRMVDRFVALALPENSELGEIPVPQLHYHAEDRQQALSDFNLNPDYAPVLALCPGSAFGSAKQWPAENFALLARHYIDQGWQVWLFGSAEDRAVSDRIRQGCPMVIDLVGRTTLPEALDLLSCATAVVSNDSGLMHVAAGLHRPLVAIYGSSDPGFTPPLSQQSRIVSLDLPCSPCFKRECPAGHLDCLRKVTVARVNESLGDLLQAHAPVI
ncbi:MAG: lipopolysaccharide heptosyltransferase II [gamma proteobacterium symbiont of Bathyaustriella thionipta]|nr:lipopolysaccharide heptosyltransferase II [gamma proteobacterium symbiont of Bathyaustriella thionipta]